MCELGVKDVWRTGIIGEFGQGRRGSVGGEWRGRVRDGGLGQAGVGGGRGRGRGRHRGGSAGDVEAADPELASGLGIALEQQVFGVGSG